MKLASKTQSTSAFLQRKIWIVLLLSVCIQLQAQPVYYSEARTNLSSGYFVLGKVGSNIIVWVLDLSSYQSNILLYNDRMKIVSSVSTDILKSGIAPNPHFFSDGNSFSVCYSYKQQNNYLYKISSFNKNGVLLNTVVSDKWDKVDDTKTVYQLIQSPDKHTIGYIKITDNNTYQVLNISCRLYSGSSLQATNFALPFNSNNTLLDDAILTDNNSLLFSVREKTDSGSTFKIIKKEFSENKLTIARRHLSKGFITGSGLHISNKTNRYFIFSQWHNADTLKRNKTVKLGLYVWQLDSALNDIPGDTVFTVKPNNANFFTFEPELAAYNKDAFVLALRGNSKYSNKEIIIPFPTNVFNYPVSDQQHIIPADPSLTRTPEAIEDYFLPSVPRGLGDYMARPSSAELPSYYTSPNYSVPEYYTSPNYSIPTYNEEGVIMFAVTQNNVLKWTLDFTGNANTGSHPIISNAKIAVTPEAIHLIYSGIVKKSTTLGHTLVFKNGSSTTRLSETRIGKIDYDIRKAVQTSSSTVIIPFINNKKGFGFAKLDVD